MERLPTPLCACIIFWSVFTLHHCLQVSKKSANGLFDPFLFFFSFLKNDPSKSDILVLMDRNGCTRFTCIRGYAQAF